MAVGSNPKDAALASILNKKRVANTNKSNRLIFTNKFLSFCSLLYYKKIAKKSINFSKIH